MKVALPQYGPVDSEHAAVLWGQGLQYHTKMKYNNRGEWTQERVISDYPDQDNEKHDAYPGFGKNMSSRRLVYVSGRWIFLSSIIFTFWADFAGWVLTSTKSIGNIKRLLFHCRAAAPFRVTWCKGNIQMTVNVEVVRDSVSRHHAT